MTEQPQPPESPEDAAEETSGGASVPLVDVPAPIEGAAAPAPIEGAAAPAPTVVAPAVAPAPPPAPEPPPPLPPLPAPEPSGAGAGTRDRPEIAVGAAFAGGILFAMILKRLAR